VVPEKIEDEINAAKLTCFVTEGDKSVTGDYIEIKGSSAATYTRLWDGMNTTSNSKSSPNNIWSGQSMILGSNDGVDIDTPGINPTLNPPQYITWDSNILKPKDTSASINLVTGNDYFFLVYMILSFRSETTMGGALSYLIHG